MRNFIIVLMRIEYLQVQIWTYSFLSLLIILPAFSNGQITGRVIGSDGMPVNYANVFDLKTKTGCVADSAGFFSINASLNDSVRIQHLSYKTGNFVLSGNSGQYELSRNLNEIKEVIVSRTYAAWLAIRSGEKAISRMQHEPRDRMYCNAVKTMNNDTLDQIFLDLDFERNQSGNAKDGVIYNRLIEIQRYCQQFNHNPDPTPGKIFLSEIFPEKNLPVIIGAESKEKGMQDDVIINISTDSQYIRVWIIPKKNAPLYRAAFELTISKEDTCLVAFAVATYRVPAILSKNFENKPDESDNAFYYKISFENGSGYISEAYSEKNLYYSIGNKKYANKFAFNLSNYSHSAVKQKKRPGSWVIKNRFGFMNKSKSKYSEEFWKNEGFPLEAPYDFIKLRALKQSISM